MSAAERAVTLALEKARGDGITVKPGASADWSGGANAIPRAVNWAGAVLWSADTTRANWTFQRVLEILGVDAAWYYRMTIGFDQGRVLSIVDPKTSEVIGQDSVSAFGRRMRREFCP